MENNTHSVVFTYDISLGKDSSEVVAVQLNISERILTDLSTESVLTSSTEGKVIALGNIDSDGEATIIDATCIWRHLV